MQWFECDNGHKICLEGDSKTLIKKALYRDPRRGMAKIVCPHCKPDNVFLSPCDPDEDKITEQYSKKFHCSAGHITVIYPFANGMCNISYGDKSHNIEADPNLMMALLADKSVRCYHKTDDNFCDKKLKPIDDTPLTLPTACGYKTTVRVEDIWNKYGCPEPVMGRHEFRKRGDEVDAQFVDTEFSRRFRERQKSNTMWIYDPKTNKQKKIKRPRTRPSQGEIMKKPTRRRYN